MGDKSSRERSQKNDSDKAENKPSTPSLSESTNELDSTGHSTTEDIILASEKTGKSGLAPPIQRSATAERGYINYDPGPDWQTLSTRYEIDFVKNGQAQKIQRLVKEFGNDRVSGWVDEGMTVEMMGKPRDMKAFRERQAVRPAEIPRDIERRNEASLQRNRDANLEEDKASDRGVPDEVQKVISSPGQSLEEKIQRKMERKMGDEFTDVRIHTGLQAAHAADTINARAFTMGNHIAFNRGEYDPESLEGQRLLAHELIHVRQQIGGALSMVPKANDELVIDPDPALEREAEKAAEEITEDHEKIMRMGTEMPVHPPEISSAQRNLSIQRDTEYDVEIGQATVIDIVKDTRWELDWPDPWNDKFWEKLKSNLKKIADRWTDEYYDPAINGFYGFLDKEGGSGGLSSAIFATIATGLGLLPGPGKFIAAAIQVSKEVVETLEEMDKPINNLGQFYNKLLETIPEIHNQLKRRFMALAEESQSGGSGENQDDYRLQVLNDVINQVNNLPSKSEIMQPFVLAWIKETSEDRWLESDWKGLSSGYIQVAYNYWPELDTWGIDDEPFIDDIPNAPGTIDALKDSFGENFYLHDLPFQMNVIITSRATPTGDRVGGQPVTTRQSEETRLIKYHSPDGEVGGTQRFEIHGDEEVAQAWVNDSSVHPTISDLTTD